MRYDSSLFADILRSERIVYVRTKQRVWLLLSRGGIGDSVYVLV